MSGRSIFACSSGGGLERRPAITRAAMASCRVMRSGAATSILSLHRISPVAVATSWAVTRKRSRALRKLPTSTQPTASSSPTCRGSTFCPTYGAMYDEGRTTSERTWPSSVITPSARPNS